ncbi:unnamed protein product [Ilex paraguariensis]|uniref:N-acetyltransferase ESCO acetyl-transferase domain-containing protein n=1 Tax=Ilex paraguariensis TaxID=185542 RepID=A0ABC8UZ85_9AQUA
MEIPAALAGPEGCGDDGDGAWNWMAYPQALQGGNHVFPFGYADDVDGVYLFISHHRIAGCLVAEPIKSAYRVLPNTVMSKGLGGTTARKNSLNFSALQFGDISFQREAVKGAPLANSPKPIEADLMGAVFLEKEAVTALCGIRVIWVAPAMRKKRIASQLLDAARISFCKGFALKTSQLAFSDPTSSGKALASRYCGTAAFLAYKTFI